MSQDTLESYKGNVYTKHWYVFTNLFYLFYLKLRFPRGKFIRDMYTHKYTYVYLKALFKYINTIRSWIIQNVFFLILFYNIISWCSNKTKMRYKLMSDNQSLNYSLLNKTDRFRYKYVSMPNNWTKIKYTNLFTE